MSKLTIDGRFPHAAMLVSMALCLAGAFARADTRMTLTYDYDDTNMIATVTGIAETNDVNAPLAIYASGAWPHFGNALVIPPSTPNGYRVVAIADFAFEFAEENSVLSNATSIIFPTTITNIGVRAFEGCDSITNIVIPEGVEGLSIGDEAFHRCSLSSVAIPEGVVRIGTKAFAFQTPNGGETFTLEGTIILPESLEELGYHAFASNLVYQIEFKGKPPTMPVPYWLDDYWGRIYWEEDLRDGAFVNWGAETIAYHSCYALEWGQVEETYSLCEDMECWVTFECVDGMPKLDIGDNFESVTNAIESANFADAAVMDAIGGSVANYIAFREWAQRVPGGEAAVVASTNAAVSWLLGAKTLFANKPEIRITGLEIGEAPSSAAESGAVGAMSSMIVTVEVKDGESIAIVAAEKVATMFEATSDLCDWKGASKLTPTVSDATPNANGTMTFTVTTGDKTSKSAFLRIKVQ